MARRSDHSREELKAMAIAAGQQIIAQEGFGNFSARKVAKEIGYTIGTIYNVFESHDHLILHINAKTLADIGTFFSENIDAKLEGMKAIKQLARLYIEFAEQHHNRWSALFEHHLPPETPLPDWYGEQLSKLFAVVEVPILPLARNNHKKAEQAAKTIWASIHGICALGLTGKLDVVGAGSVRLLVDNLIDHYMAGLTHGK